MRHTLQERPHRSPRLFSNCLIPEGMIICRVRRTVSHGTCACQSLPGGTFPKAVLEKLFCFLRGHPYLWCRTAVNPEAPLSREAGIFIGAGLAAFILLIRRYSSYTYRDRIFSREFGWGSLAQVRKLPLDEVASVVVRRGVVHRLVGIGHLHFQPGSAKSPDLWWFGVDQPFEVKKKVEQILRRESLVRK